MAPTLMAYSRMSEGASPALSIGSSHSAYADFRRSDFIVRLPAVASWAGSRAHASGDSVRSAPTARVMEANSVARSHGFGKNSTAARLSTRP
jgi:hypothetical protein